MVLFIVETSLSGFFGSGESPTSAVESTSHDGLVGNPARQLHVVLQSELVAQRHDLVVAVARAHEGEGDVLATEVVYDVGCGPDRQVDAVLGAHDADIGDEVPPAAPQRRDGGRPTQALVVGAGTHHGDLRLAPCHPAASAISAYEAFVATTWSAVRKVAFSRASSPRRASGCPCGKRESYSSGQRSWWSNTNREPSRRRSQRAMGQKMSGGLHACSTSNLPLRDEHGAPAVAVARNEYAYSRTKPSALPPGA